MRVSVACSTALLLGLLLAKVKADVCADFANGCSVPFEIQVFNKDHFTPGCNRHDVCHQCGEVYGQTQLSCDKACLADMRSTCQQARRRRSPRKRFFSDGILPSKKTLCEGVAYNYYLAVRAVGYLHFQSQAWDFNCGSSSIIACLPSEVVNDTVSNPVLPPPA